MKKTLNIVLVVIVVLHVFLFSACNKIDVLEGEATEHMDEEITTILSTIFISEEVTTSTAMPVTEDPTNFATMPVTEKATTSTTVPIIEGDLKMIEKHKKTFSERFDFSEPAIENIAEVLTSLGIQEIKNLVVEEETKRVIAMRITDSTEQVYYVVLSGHGYFGTVRKNSMQEEPIYYLKND